MSKRGGQPWPQVPMFGGPDETPAPVKRAPRVVAEWTPWEPIRLTPDHAQYTAACQRDSELGIRFGGRSASLGCKGRGRWLFARWKGDVRYHLVLCETDGREFAEKNGINLAEAR